MRKILLTTTLLIIIGFSSSAQSLGIIGGLAKTNIRSNFLTDASGTAGFTIGAINFIPLSDELLIYQDFTINTSGMTATLYEFDQDFNGNTTVIAHPEEKLSWFTVQYSMGPTFAYDDGLFYGGAGLSINMVSPTGGAFNQSNISSGYFTTKEEYDYSASNLSSDMFGFFGGVYLVAGGGSESLKLQLKYSLMFSNLAKSEFTESDNKMYADVLTLTLAYLFY